MNGNGIRQPSRMIVEIALLVVVGSSWELLKSIYFRWSEVMRGVYLSTWVRIRSMLVSSGGVRM